MLACALKCFDYCCMCGCLRQASITRCSIQSLTTCFRPSWGRWRCRCRWCSAGSARWSAQMWLATCWRDFVVPLLRCLALCCLLVAFWLFSFRTFWRKNKKNFFEILKWILRNFLGLFCGYKFREIMFIFRQWN